jgi:hypothetical protein
MEFEKLFMESKGKPIIYNGKTLKMIDEVILKESKANLKITFISSDSIWNQGLVIKTKGEFQVNKQKIPDKIILWQDTSPKKVELLVISEDKKLIIYNVWKTQDGTIHYWHNGGAMNIEEREGTRIYNCNDGYPDDDFNDLIFEINFKG